MDYDVIIIGGGPAGLIAAREIAGAGAKVCVVEEHQEIGYPVQCSGLYSISGLKALGLSLDESIISNTIKGGRFYSPLGREFTAYSNVERAHVVEKKLFDKYLAKRAARAGAEFKLKTRAEEVAIDTGVRVRTDGIYGEETLKSELLIGADGVRSTIARHLGLKTPKKIVAAIQVEVDDVETERDIAEVYFGRRYAPNFYAWILPKDRTYEVGLGVRRPEAKLKEYLARFMRQHPVASKKIHGSSIVEMNVGSFAVETVDRSVAERALIVGDAAGQVKASTGGGVITGGIAARLAGEACVKALEEENYSAPFLRKHYEDRWRAEIGFELQVHESLRELFDSLSDEELEELFDLAIEERIDELMGKYQDTDKPSEFVKELLKNERMLTAVEKFLNYDVLARG
jgi:geranylgeranyl reductase family protein